MSGFKVEALYPYDSEADDDLPFQPGQVITVTQALDAEWYEGFYRNSEGKTLEGIFPISFVKKIDEPPVPQLPSKRPTVTHAATTTAPDIAPATTSLPQSPAATTSKSQTAPKDAVAEPSEPSQIASHPSDDDWGDSNYSDGDDEDKPVVIKPPSADTLPPKNDLTSESSEIEEKKEAAMAKLSLNPKEEAVARGGAIAVDDASEPDAKTTNVNQNIQRDTQRDAQRDAQKDTQSQPLPERTSSLAAMPPVEPPVSVATERELPPRFDSGQESASQEEQPQVADFKTRMAMFNRQAEEKTEKVIPHRQPKPLSRASTKTFDFEQEPSEPVHRTIDNEEAAPSMSFKERIAMLKQRQEEDRIALEEAEKRLEQRRQKAKEAAANIKSLSAQEAQNAGSEAAVPTQHLAGSGEPTGGDNASLEDEFNDAIGPEKHFDAAPDLATVTDPRHTVSDEASKEIKDNLGAATHDDLTNIEQPSQAPHVPPQIPKIPDTTQRVETNPVASPRSPVLPPVPVAPSVPKVPQVKAPQPDSQSLDEGLSAKESIEGGAASRTRTDEALDGDDEDADVDEEEARRIALRERMARLAGAGSSAGGLNLGMLMGGFSHANRGERTYKDKSAMSQVEREREEAREQVDSAQPVSMMGFPGATLDPELLRRLRPAENDEAEEDTTEPVNADVEDDQSKAVTGESKPKVDDEAQNTVSSQPAHTVPPVGSPQTTHPSDLATDEGTYDEDSEAFGTPVPASPNAPPPPPSASLVNPHNESQHAPPTPTSVQRVANRQSWSEDTGYESDIDTDRGPDNVNSTNVTPQSVPHQYSRNEPVATASPSVGSPRSIQRSAPPIPTSYRPPPAVPGSATAGTTGTAPNIGHSTSISEPTEPLPAHETHRAAPHPPAHAPAIPGAAPAIPVPPVATSSAPRPPPPPPHSPQDSHPTSYAAPTPTTSLPPGPPPPQPVDRPRAPAPPVPTGTSHRAPPPVPVPGGAPPVPSRTGPPLPNLPPKLPTRGPPSPTVPAAHAPPAPPVTQAPPPPPAAPTPSAAPPQPPRAPHVPPLTRAPPAPPIGQGQAPPVPPTAQAPPAPPAPPTSQAPQAPRTPAVPAVPAVPPHNPAPQPPPPPPKVPPATSTAGYIPGIPQPGTQAPSVRSSDVDSDYRGQAHPVETSSSNHEVPTWVLEPQGVPPGLVEPDDSYRVYEGDGERRILVVHSDFTFTQVRASLHTGSLVDSSSHPAPAITSARLKSVSQRVGKELAVLTQKHPPPPNNEDEVKALLSQVDDSVSTQLGIVVYENFGNASVNQVDEIRVGDIAVCEDAKFHGAKGPLSKYTRNEDHSVYVVAAWDGAKRKLHVYDAKKGDALRIGDLKSGIVRIYRPVDFHYFLS